MILEGCCLGRLQPILDLGLRHLQLRFQGSGAVDNDRTLYKEAHSLRVSESSVYLTVSQSGAFFMTNSYLLGRQILGRTN